jgi:hypothetical protein
MANVEYENVITSLYEALPDLQGPFEKRSKELYGHGLPHIVYGSVLVEYVESLADNVELPDDEVSDKRLKRVFGFIEELSGSDDSETIYLVQTGFLEGLAGLSSGLQRFATYMETAEIVRYRAVESPDSRGFLRGLARRQLVFPVGIDA